MIRHSGSGGRPAKDGSFTVEGALDACQPLPCWTALGGIAGPLTWVAAGGWHLNSLSADLATPAQLSSVLANLTGLTVRAEHQTGPDVRHLDTVVLVPEPASVALRLAGLAARRHRS